MCIPGRLPTQPTRRIEPPPSPPSSRRLVLRAVGMPPAPTLVLAAPRHPEQPSPTQLLQTRESRSPIIPPSPTTAQPTRTRSTLFAQLLLTLHGTCGSCGCVDGCSHQEFPISISFKQTQETKEPKVSTMPRPPSPAAMLMPTPSPHHHSLTNLTTSLSDFPSRQA